MDKAQKIINSAIYITIATVDNVGQPWNTPVSAFHDNQNNFYWASWKENQHSKNIISNGKAFIVIYDTNAPTGTGEGVYIQAKANEISSKEEITEFSKFDKNPQNPKDFLGTSPRRFYKAVPQQMWLNADGEVDGHFVDIRKEVL